jgi:hypothetical protein
MPSKGSSWRLLISRARALTALLLAAVETDELFPEFIKFTAIFFSI